MSENGNHGERIALERLLLANLQEQQRSRRWGIFFKLLIFIWLFSLIGIAFMHEEGDLSTRTDHTALIEIQGEIGGQDGVQADGVILALADAFENSHTKGVVLRCNSPGGSPVQAGQIFDEVRRQRSLHPEIPVYAVVDDICASGGYYIIAAADKIFVDKASIVGSIGVLMDGFGFTETMHKLGIERRLLTAGENKGFLDPFSPADPQQEAFARAMLEEIHLQFIDVVRTGRGKRLKETPEMFSGLVWSGAKSMELGLSDGLGTLDSVAREVVQAEDIVDYSPKEDLADRIARRLGTAIGDRLSPLTSESIKLR